jgi:hypothetical protein
MDERAGRTEWIQATAWLGMFALGFLAMRGTLPLLLVPGVVLVLVLAVLGLAVATHAMLALQERLAERMPSQRLLWLLPIVDLAVAFCAVALPLAVPSWIGDYELWKDLLGVPPTPFTRLVTALFVLITFQVFYLFVKLVVRFFTDPKSWERASGDGVTSIVCASGLVFLACLLLYGQAHRAHNVLYLKGWMSLALAGRPAQAITHFGEVVERYPDSGIADACLYRIARIESEELSRPADAESRLKALVKRWPTSPFLDDALFDLGDLALARDDAAEAERLFAEVGTRFPRSYLTERAALGRARALGRAGRRAEGAKVLDNLIAGPARGRIVSEVDGRVVVTPLVRAVQEMRERLGKP